jgi:outer membrane protein assembly factor BamB
MAVPAPAPRLWPAIVLVGFCWAANLLLGWIDASMFALFLSRAAICLVCTLLFVVWWLTNRRIPWRERWMVLGVAVGAGIVGRLLADSTVITVLYLFMGLPWLMTAWTGWLLIARLLSAPARRVGLLVVVSLVWAPFQLMRMEGLVGDGSAEIRWRLSPTEEQHFLDTLAERGQVSGPRAALTLGPSDWPGFRGPGRDGIVRGVKIATDWEASPPRQLWRQRVGPGWSSFAVVGDRIFTQEQRGKREAVVCLDAASGHEVWAREDTVRFEEGLAGAGPRATPTFADGRLYALGATGILNCLDAATGERLWSRDIAVDAGAKLPQWGFVSSPLVAGDVVVVFAGGSAPQQLLAYRAATGTLAWTAAAGTMSYSSPQMVSVGGRPQVLFLAEGGLTAVDPATGKVLWEHEAPWAGPALPRSLQPQQLSATKLLMAADDLGTVLLELKRDGGAWQAERRWTSTALKPAYNDFVVQDGAVYGFHGGILGCIDLHTGKRRWRGGRYGKGQLLLLAEQKLLLVLAEDGQVVLVTANPDRHEELGSFQAIEGKTWNHPVIAHGRLYVRNAREMACYDLTAGADR